MFIPEAIIYAIINFHMCLILENAEDDVLYLPVPTYLLYDSSTIVPGATGLRVIITLFFIYLLLISHISYF
jgi:hypothetical protein